MATLFQTLTIVPASDGRRFRAVSLGQDRCETVRTEFIAVRAVVASLCGVAPDALTQEDVTALQTFLDALDPAERTSWRTIGTADG